MITLLALWGFISFIFFKIALDIGLGATVTTTYALLLGAMVAVSVFHGTRFYSIAAGKYFAQLNIDQSQSYFTYTLNIWLVIATSNLLLGKMIAFGFSKELNRKLGGDLL